MGGDACVALSGSSGRFGPGLGLLAGMLGFVLDRAGSRLGHPRPRLADVATLGDSVGHDATHELARANGIVVAGNDEAHDVGVAVRVDHGNDRDTQLVGLGHRDVLFLGVEHENGARQLLHVADATEVALELVELAAEEERLLLGHRLELARHPHALVVLHLVHALGDGLEVGQHAAQPSLVDVGHAAPLGVALHAVLGLLLGADEQQGATVGDHVADEGIRRGDVIERLLEVDDVDAGALAVDEPLHLRVPTAGLVSEMDAGFEQLSKSHDRGHGGLLLRFDDSRLLRPEATEVR